MLLQDGGFFSEIFHQQWIFWQSRHSGYCGNSVKSLHPLVSKRGQERGFCLQIPFVFWQSNGTLVLHRNTADFSEKSFTKKLNFFKSRNSNDSLPRLTREPEISRKLDFFVSTKGGFKRGVVTLFLSTQGAKMEGMSKLL